MILLGFFYVPASLSRYITWILTEMLDVFIIVYLDNILIYTKKADDIVAV